MEWCFHPTVEKEEDCEDWNEFGIEDMSVPIEKPL